MNELFGLLLKGGIIMVPIGLASLAGLAVVLERIWALRQKNVHPEGLLGRVEEVLVNKGPEAALVLVENDTSSLGRLLCSALSRRQADPEQTRARLEEIGRREAHRIGRHIEIVGILAAVSPLLGLLGTVTGMITVFRRVMVEAASRGINPASLASGIWEALVTTAAGLAVAIPLYLAYRLLHARAENWVATLETDIGEFCELLFESGKPGGADC